MTISAKVIADSVNSNGSRVTTLLLRYPRFIHSEFMTHRVFSRCASSSRAIPVAKIIQSIKDDPAMPIHWGKNQPGMQAAMETYTTVTAGIGMVDEPVLCGDITDISAQKAWLLARDACIQVAEGFHKAGYHKQIVNRLLEPWSHINVVVTATEWNSFFELRIHEDAQPEIQALAITMRDAMRVSVPEVLEQDDWHLPFITMEDRENIVFHAKECRITRDEPSDGELNLIAAQVSAARCARTSYLLHDGKPSTIEQDLTLYARLAGSQPIHASPLEHPCRPAYDSADKAKNQRNLIGFVQLRAYVD